MVRQLFSIDELARLLLDGAQLVDVLDPEDFEHSHIPGAFNVPLKQLTKAAVTGLDRSRPVVVYCNDFG